MTRNFRVWRHFDLIERKVYEAYTPSTQYCKTKNLVRPWFDESISPCCSKLRHTKLCNSFMGVKHLYLFTHKPKTAHSSPMHKHPQGTNGRSLSQHSQLHHFHGKHF